jgi:S1-C subfamily serine protease
MKIYLTKFDRDNGRCGSTRIRGIAIGNPLRLEETVTVLVVQVERRSPAAKAGLRAGIEQSLKLNWGRKQEPLCSGKPTSLFDN